MLTLNTAAQTSSLALFADAVNQPETLMVAGVAVRQDAHGRFCLNDLHKAAGGENRHRPSLWADNQQAKDLIAEIEIGAGIPALVSNQRGMEQGTYVCKELVYAYAMWVSASFHLQVIRAYDGMVQAKMIEPMTATLLAPATTPLGQDLEALQILASWLNVAPSGQVGMARVAVAHHAPHLLPALPGYAIDAPSTHTAGSSQPTASATELLKKHGATIGAAKFNQLLADAGIIEQLTRPSTSKGQKAFWSITPAGERYGKNVTSPRNQRETQPHWYVGQFGALLEAVGVA